MSVETSQGDAELLAATRNGNAAAYGGLYERHAPAARALARRLVRSAAEAEDVVAETFTRILDLTGRGGGPKEAFRIHLLTAVRRTVTERDWDTGGGPAGEGAGPSDLAVPFVDPALAGLERSLVARAFFSLPERWQLLLWHLEVENADPAEVAPLIGLPAEEVAELVARAKEGLRQACLKVHLTGAHRKGCRPVLSKLGAYVRGGLAKRETRVIDRHMDGCADCRSVFMELTDVDRGMRVIVGPLVAGPVLDGYLTALGKTGAAPAGGLAGCLGGLGSAAGWARRSSRGRQQAVAGSAAVIAIATATALVLVTSGDPAVIRPAPGALPVPVTSPPIVAEPEPFPDEAPLTPSTLPPSPGAPSLTAPSLSVPSPGTPSPTGAASGPARPGAVTPRPPKTPPPVRPPRPAREEPVPARPPHLAAPAQGRKVGLRHQRGGTRVPAPRLDARIDALGALVRAQTGMVAVRLRNTGRAGSRAVVARIDLPKGVTLMPGGLRTRVAALPGARTANGAGTGGVGTGTVGTGGVGTVDGWSCRPVSRAVRCARAPLAPGQGTSIFLRVAVDRTAPLGVPLRLQVTGGGPKATAVTESGVRAVGAPARFAADGRVTTAAIGNTLLTRAPTGRMCRAARSRDGGARDNDAAPMRLYDQDRDPATKNSSAARLDLPNRGRVVWAGLYWSASAPAAGRTIKFRAPGDAGYTQVRAARVAEQELPSGRAYQAFADVTRLVRKLRGKYWVADVPLRPGVSRHAGWSLVVIAADPRQPYRQAMVVDTTALVQAGSPARIPLDGLTHTGMPARMDLVTWEGDADLRGDRVSLGQGPLQPEGGDRNPDNPFDGSSTGSAKVELTPGVDVDRFQATLGPRPVLRVSTRRDAVLFGVAAVSVQTRS
ncbi:zf-HC2 domain-containing protein [Planomonospora corallina]|uniref:Zf-HC2 domain-containing protein n=1 Tax=Planomonospora corallina TaxID=1806052 RepID=A0ABV8I652_9ACTN